MNFYLPVISHIFCFFEKPSKTQFANEGHMNEGCHASLAYGTDFLDSCWSSQKAISMCVRSALSKMDLAHSMSKKDSAKQHLCSQLSLWPLWWPSFGLISS